MNACALLERPPARISEVRDRIDPLMLRAMEAFWRDLPRLLAGETRKQQWVAYHGDERIGFGKTKTELYQLCLGRGLQHGEFYVAKLEVDPEEIPPWGTHEGDWSLYEINQGDDEPLSPSVK